jgi:hypothetical protein
MKNSALLFGIFSMLSMFLLFYLVFTVAYYSPAKKLVIDINSYGEADAEMIMLTALLPLNLIATVIAAGRIAKGEIADKAKGRKLF